MQTHLKRTVVARSNDCRPLPNPPPTHTPPSPITNGKLFPRRTQFVRFLDVGLILNWAAVPGFRAAFEPGAINWDVDVSQLKQPTVVAEGALIVNLPYPPKRRLVHVPCVDISRCFCRMAETL